RLSALNRALNDISVTLRGGGGSLKQYGFPEPRAVASELDEEAVAFSPEVLAQYRLRFPRFYASLNDDQRKAFDQLADAASNRRDRCNRGYGTLLFINGAGGRGKSYLLKGFIDYLRGQDLSVTVCGSTALCVQDHFGARTAHSLFGIPVTTNE